MIAKPEYKHKQENILVTSRVSLAIVVAVPPTVQYSTVQYSAFQYSAVQSHLPAMLLASKVLVPAESMAAQWRVPVCHAHS